MSTWRAQKLQRHSCHHVINRHAVLLRSSNCYPSFGS
ncbi:rCG37045, partial [Rattus norvegicus]